MTMSATNLLSRPAAGLLAAVFSGLAMLAAPAQGASAADYPARPIHLIVPYPPGGSTDPVARMLAAEAGPLLGQPIVVENRPGASGAIGTDAVARAAPDGYTILLHTSVIATDPTLKPDAPYDVQRDLAPITQAVTGPYVVVTNTQVPATTLQELIAYARERPGKTFYGSAGTGSSGHLVGALFSQAAGVELTHVPYKGGGPSITGLIGNEVQLLFDTVPGSRSLIEAGKLRALAVTSAERSAALPAVPTVAEAGLPGLTTVYWLGGFAPAGTPPAIIDRLYAAFRDTLQKPEVQARLREQGNVAQALPPAEFAKVLADDIARYRQVIQARGIRLE